jgi:hypothetical protein
MKLKDDLMLMESYEKVLEEAKKKVNPWAVCNASTGGKKKEPKKFEKCVKGVKKKTGYVEENENVSSLKDMTYAKSGGYVNPTNKDITPGTTSQTQQASYAKKNPDEDLAEWLKVRIRKGLPQDNDIMDDLVKLLNKLNAHKLGQEISNPTP